MTPVQVDARPVEARPDAAVDKERRWIVPAAIAATALLSVLLSGHRSGDNNNLFHLPILTGLYDEPQFARDVFIQSLRYYVSGFWMLFAGAADDQTVLWFFLPLQLLSRALFFAGVAMWAPLLGLAGWRRGSLLLLIVALAETLRRAAPAGDGGIFVENFTHSELCNGTSLIALALAARGRYGWAFAVAGVTFFVNMFMAVWLAPPLAALAATAWRRDEVDLATLARRSAPGLLAAGLLAVPVLARMVTNPDFGRPLNFDYPDFLVEYWPHHFLVQHLRLGHLLKFAGLVAAGAVAALALHPGSRRNLLPVFGGYLAVWAIGALLPFLTSSATLINLHLLRVSGMIAIVATLAIATHIVRFSLSEDRADRHVWAPALLLSLAIDIRLVAAAALLLMARTRLPVPSRATHRLIPLIALVVVLGAATMRAVEAFRADQQFRAAQRRWAVLAEWARERTDRNAVFLLPPYNIRSDGPLPASPPGQDRLVQASELFPTTAHRGVWVTGKQGAAVMWWPRYYEQWRTRLIETLELPDVPSRLSYARRHGIAFVVDECAAAGAPAPAFRSGPLCAYAAAGRS